ncbi:MAG TPA: hypothetical protein ENN13_02550 [Candidatus Altiarchaeales archaeon]|nr:hypothetical protein [Candidatus Altiarchaeales archaeon]
MLYYFSRSLNESLLIFGLLGLLSFLSSIPVVFFSGRIPRAKKNPDFRILFYSFFAASIILSILVLNTVSAVRENVFQDYRGWGISLEFTFSLLFLPLGLPLVFLFYNAFDDAAPFLKNAIRLNLRMRVWMGVLALLILTAAANVAPEFWSERVGAGKPNIVLITVDTLRADHLGVYGYGRNTSPNIDEFSRSAVVFRNAVTPMPTTSPAHASILTGNYPARHGVLTNGWILGGENLLISEMLLEEGYRTRAIVSVTQLGSKFGFAQGFLSFDDEFKGHSQPSKDASDRALEWINGAREPFFLWIHYWDPHAPYAPPAEHDVFKNPDYAGGIDFYDDPPSGRVDEGLRESDFERITSLYDAEVRYTDFEVGRFLRELDSKGFGDNSIVVITADHGENLDELIQSHDFGFDHSKYLYDGTVHIPLIMRFPMQEIRTGFVESQVSNLDITPTLIDYLGSWGKYGFDGSSLLECIDDDKCNSDVMFIQRRYQTAGDKADYPDFAVRSLEWKYILDEHPFRQELYNLRDDPGETENVTVNNSEVSMELHEKLVLWREGFAAVEGQEISKSTEDMLRALGYLA